MLPLPLVDYHPNKHDNTAGGFARLSTLVNNIRKEQQNNPVLLFSSGDFTGGSPFAWLAPLGYSPELEVMKKVGYNAIAIGNHEFDHGTQTLAEYLLRANYPESHEKLALLSSNLMIPDNNILNKPEIQENYLFTLSNNIKLGVFSLMGSRAYSVMPPNISVSIEEPLKTSKKQVKLLKDAGADIIIAVTHSGIEEDRLIAKKTEGIDIILGGHDHIKTNEPEIINNTIILHSGYNLEYMGVLELSFDVSEKKLKVLNFENNTPFLTKIDSEIEEDKEVADIIENYGKKLNDFISTFTDGLINDYAETVMYSEYPMTRSDPKTEATVGNFIADAIRIITEEVTGENVDIAFQANGIIRGDVIPGSMAWSKGEVSFYDLVSISALGKGYDGFPGYPVVSLYLTGEDVYKLLEIASLLPKVLGNAKFLQFSGLKYTYNPNKTFWINMPSINFRLPAYRSVKMAELYYGKGIQSGDKYKKIKKCDTTLYHIATDYHLASYLPIISEALPRLEVVPRNKNGHPYQDMEKTIITNKNREFKVWEAITRYAISFEKNEAGIPVLPVEYKEVQGRIVAEKFGIPLFVWIYSVLILILVLIGTFLVYKRRSKKT